MKTTKIAQSEVTKEDQQVPSDQKFLVKNLKMTFTNLHLAAAIEVTEAESALKNKMVAKSLKKNPDQKHQKKIKVNTETKLDINQVKNRETKNKELC